MRKPKFELLEKIYFESSDNENELIIGVIAELTELNAVCEDEDGDVYEETIYTVLYNKKDGSLTLEEMLESNITKYENIY